MFEYVDFLHFDFRGIWGIISNGNRTEGSPSTPELYDTKSYYRLIVSIT